MPGPRSCTVVSTTLFVVVTVFCTTTITTSLVYAWSFDPWLPLLPRLQPLRSPCLVEGGHCCGGLFARREQGTIDRPYHRHHHERQQERRQFRQSSISNLEFVLNDDGGGDDDPLDAFDIGEQDDDMFDDDDSSASSNTILEGILVELGYHRRLMRLTQNDLPVVAEIFANGQTSLCAITHLFLEAEASSATSSTTRLLEPKVLAIPFCSKNDVNKSSNQALRDGGVVYDWSQITSIWFSIDQDDLPDLDNTLSQTAIQAERERYPEDVVERALDALYRSHVGRGRSSGQALHKKQIPALLEQFYTNHLDNETNETSFLDERMHAEATLRKVIKAGNHMARLVDASELADECIQSYLQRRRRRRMNDAADNLRVHDDFDWKMQQQAVAAQLLAHDAALGGRFKRWPCVFVAAEHETSSDPSVSFRSDRDEARHPPTVSAVTFLNGGWLVVDRSVRAGMEARKFVERWNVHPNDDPVDPDSSPSKASNKKRNFEATLADERIIRRMECLAMGEEALKEDDSNIQSDNNFDRQLQLDLRMAIHAMDLPLSPDGARQALLQIGRWSGADNLSRMQPWSREVLDAANEYVQMDQDSCDASTQPHGALNGRVDCRNLVSVAVDAKGTAFRDDAISVRFRRDTGRRWTKEASEIELLIHIADVSDVYMAEEYSSPDYLTTLRKAAESRGTSRYDLPLGPLHLLPPKVLGSKSLSNNERKYNSCVTLWVYIDERNGKIIDSGLERTALPPSIMLSFDEANDLLERPIDGINKSNFHIYTLQRASEVLKIWNQRHRKVSVAASKREQRLTLRETIEGEFWAEDGFQRTQAHRMVDSAMDLYATVVTHLLRQSQAPIPRARGADAARGGRVATAPLRRYIDGMAQRQAVAVLCDYGIPLTASECIQAGQRANEARNAIFNVRAGRS